MRQGGLLLLLLFSHRNNFFQFVSVRSALVDTDCNGPQLLVDKPCGFGYHGDQFDLVH